MLTFGSLLLTAGTLADRFGRKRIFASGIMLFVAGSIASIFAQSILIIDILRALQGIGAAAALAGSSAATAQEFDGHARTKAFSMLPYLAAVMTRWISPGILSSIGLLIASSGMLWLGNIHSGAGAGIAAIPLNAKKLRLSNTIERLCFKAQFFSRSLLLRSITLPGNMHAD